MFEQALATPEKRSSSSAKPVSGRYFIELHVTIDPEASRAAQDQTRRHQAIEFVRVITEWLRDNSMSKDVSDLSVTAMGQVMIVCTRPVIDMIREQDVWAVAHIRSSDQFNQSSLMKRGTR
jgi:hypothetical protein